MNDQIHKSKINTNQYYTFIDQTKIGYKDDKNSVQLIFKEKPRTLQPKNLVFVLNNWKSFLRQAITLSDKLIKLTYQDKNDEKHKQIKNGTIKILEVPPSKIILNNKEPHSINIELPHYNHNGHFKFKINLTNNQVEDLTWIDND